MKIKGFTLAEIMITMAIIGVIAAVTIPSLHTNVNEDASIAKYKKTIAALSNIGRMASSNNDIDYSSVSNGAVNDNNRGDDAEGELRAQLWAILDRYGSIDRNATAAGTNPGGGCESARGVVYFRDGSALCYLGRIPAGRGQLQTIAGVIDINGTKGPNRLSSCGDINCNTRKDISDQFRITLVSDMALPGQAQVNARTMAVRYIATFVTEASRWAYEK